MEWIVRCPLFSLTLSFHQRIEKSKITLPKESERRKRKSEEEKGRRKKKKAMVTLSSFLHSLWLFGYRLCQKEKKQLFSLTEEAYFAVASSKIQLDIKFSPFSSFHTILIFTDIPYVGA